MEQGNDKTIELTIDKLVTGGKGLGRHDGQAIFVPMAAPGDKVLVEPALSKKGYQEARLVEILEPGPGRREAPCPYYNECGGCDLQHLDDDAQRQARRDILLDCFTRLGKLDVTDVLIDADEAPVLGYRNKIRLAAHPTGLYGMKKRGSHDVVPLENCLVMADPYAEIIQPYLRMLPPVEQIVMRMDGQGGWLLSLYGQPARAKVLKKILGEQVDQAPAPGLQGVQYNNRPMWGRMYLVIEVAGHKFRVSHQSFFQGNLGATEQAVATVRDWLKSDHPSGGDLADLYGGVGLFTMTLSDLFERILYVDSDSSAVLDARENRRRDAAIRDKITIHQGEVDKALADPEVKEAISWPDACVVVDPPRTGLGKPVLASLSELKPKTVIYMSCDPATLARDCGVLVEAGYSVKRVKPLPMFPQTSHLETLVHLARD